MALWSRVKHSTTELPHQMCHGRISSLTVNILINGYIYDIFLGHFVLEEILSVGMALVALKKHTFFPNF